MNLQDLADGDSVFLDANILIYHLSRQTGLLSDDALILAIMRNHGLSKIASNDADFDQAPRITRYSPSAS